MNSIGGSSTRMCGIDVVLLVSPTCATVAPSRLGTGGAILTTSDPYAAAVALLTGHAAALVVDVAALPPQAEAVMALAERRGLPVRALGPGGRIVGDLGGAPASTVTDVTKTPTTPQQADSTGTYVSDGEHNEPCAVPDDAAGVLTPQEMTALLRRDA